MKLNEVIARIEARGFTVDCKPVGENLYAITALDGFGNPVAFPNVTVGKTGNVSDVALSTFGHDKTRLAAMASLGNFTGTSVAYAIASVYGDMYLAHKGRPTDAENLILAQLRIPAAPVPNPFADVPATV